MFDLSISDSPGCAVAIFYMALLAEGGRRAWPSMNMVLTGGRPALSLVGRTSTVVRRFDLTPFLRFLLFTFRLWSLAL